MDIVDVLAISGWVLFIGSEILDRIEIMNASSISKASADMGKGVAQRAKRAYRRKKYGG